MLLINISVSLVVGCWVHGSIECKAVGPTRLHRYSPRVLVKSMQWKIVDSHLDTVTIVSINHEGEHLINKWSLGLGLAKHMLKPEWGRGRGRGAWRVGFRAKGSKRRSGCVMCRWFGATIRSATAFILFLPVHHVLSFAALMWLSVWIWDFFYFYFCENTLYSFQYLKSDIYSFKAFDIDIWL